MPSLAEIQSDLLGAIISGDPRPAARHIAGDGLAPEARVDIYRHHVLVTLTAALEATFPVVRRLVGNGFFAYAADSYIREHLPGGPCLFEYGGSFPEFLAGFAPCQGHDYLPDVARLEWAVNLADHAEARAPIDRARLAALAPEDMPRLTVELDPSLSLVASRWPVDRIWLANQPGSEPGGAVDLSSGGIHLEIRRMDDRVTIRWISASRFSFRMALRAGSTLELAAATAARIDPELDLTQAVQELLLDGVWVASSLPD
ncbi:MAG TPA: DNA-binding domain-containing protein [Candidatus Methylomirabilis sp.]|nr:DNA-binding domain-containing protein [Candidatus Methylomirabilis sp.]